MKIIRTTQSRLSQVDFANLGFGSGLADHAFYAEFTNGSWDEGRVEPYGPLKQGLALHALHYGQAVFEGQKAYRQADGGIAVFRPLDNAKRLNRSGARMMIPELPERLFIDGLDALIAVDQEWVPRGANESLYLRPFLFGSSEFITARPSEDYTFGIVTSPSGELYTKPVRVKVERQFTRATSGGVGYAKAAGNYGGAFLATREAVKQGYQQVLWTDHHNHEYFEEAGTMNVAFVVRASLLGGLVALVDHLLVRLLLLGGGLVLPLLEEGDGEEQKRHATSATRMSACSTFAWPSKRRSSSFSGSATAPGDMNMLMRVVSSDGAGLPMPTQLIDHL